MSSVNDVAHAFDEPRSADDYEGMGPDGLPTHVVRRDVWTCAGCGIEVRCDMYEDEMLGGHTAGLTDPRYGVIEKSLPLTCPLGAVLQVMES